MRCSVSDEVFSNPTKCHLAPSSLLQVSSSELHWFPSFSAGPSICVPSSTLWISCSWQSSTCWTSRAKEPLNSIVRTCWSTTTSKWRTPMSTSSSYSLYSLCSAPLGLLFWSRRRGDSTNVKAGGHSSFSNIFHCTLMYCRHIHQYSRSFALLDYKPLVDYRILCYSTASRPRRVSRSQLFSSVSVFRLGALSVVSEREVLPCRCRLFNQLGAGEPVLLPNLYRWFSAVIFTFVSSFLSYSRV